MSGHDCPYCGGERFTTEFLVEVVGPPMEGYNQCMGCNKWSKNIEGGSQTAIDNPETKPVV